jgi:hypothetical protein
LIGQTISSVIWRTNYGEKFNPVQSSILSEGLLQPWGYLIIDLSTSPHKKVGLNNNDGIFPDLVDKTNHERYP